jgi:hypothetical protein
MRQTEMVSGPPKPKARRHIDRRPAEELGWLLFLLMATLPFLVRMLGE